MSECGACWYKVNSYDKFTLLLKKIQVEKFFFMYLYLNHVAPYNQEKVFSWYGHVIFMI